MNSLLFKALNDPIRREILEVLKQGDMNAGEISSRFKVSGATISHHLDILKQSGLISAKKNGQFIIYSLDTTVVEDIIKWLFELNKR